MIRSVVVSAFWAALVVGGWAESLPAQRVGADGAEMVLVAGGTFLMGSVDGDTDERPPHQVTLPAFYIDRYEVTCQQYAGFMAATVRAAPVDWPDGKLPPNRVRQPVANVTWDDAVAYAKWCGKRLPSEAEWEKAARGERGRAYPWGDSPVGKKTASGFDGHERLHPVGSFPDDVSPCGARDMAGNVWEWTADWYGAYPGNDELELAYGVKYRVIRGGGAIDYYGAISTGRCADRARSVPYATYDGLGFRCVMDAK